MFSEAIQIDEPSVQEEEDELEIEVAPTDLEYVLVHKLQLEKLFQHCPQCGKLLNQHSQPSPKAKRKRASGEQTSRKLRLAT